jgi:hypothetical protein
MRGLLLGGRDSLQCRDNYDRIEAACRRTVTVKNGMTRSSTQLASIHQHHSLVDGPKKIVDCHSQKYSRTNMF